MTVERDANEPLIKLVHCTWASGLGAGAGRMESYYYRFHNPRRYSVSAVSMRSPGQNIAEYPSPVPIQYIGGLDRFTELFRIFRQADIVQFQGSLDPLVCEVARLAKVPILVEVLHNFEAGGIFPNVDAVVCVSNAVASVQNSSPKAVTIQNGIDLSEFPFVRRTISDKIVILQVSNRAKPIYNIDEIASDILEIDPRIELWLAGHHQDLPSQDRVKFLDIREDIAELYQQADFMALFTRNEPFGLAAIEAMASGCLPILSNSGGFLEIVTHEKDGWLVDVDDFDPLIETIRTAISCTSQEEMRLAARKKVETQFEARNCVSKYEELYERLLSQKGRRMATGPEVATATAEVFLGDSMFFSHEHRWDDFDNALLNVVNSSSPLTNRTTAEMARMFVSSSQARGHQHLAAQMYQKIFDSGFNSTELIKQWMEVIEGAPWDAISRACLEYSITLPEANLLLVEKMITAKDTLFALQHLADAQMYSEKFPSTSKIYQEWHERISALLKKLPPPTRA